MTRRRNCGRSYIVERRVAPWSCLHVREFHILETFAIAHGMRAGASVPLKQDERYSLLYQRLRYASRTLMEAGGGQDAGRSEQRVVKEA
jgi:hypothetical protein